MKSERQPLAFQYCTRGYDPITREEAWDHTRVMRVTYPLAPVPGIFHQGVDEICGNATRACSPDRPPAERVYAFTAPRTGGFASTLSGGRAGSATR